MALLVIADQLVVWWEARITIGRDTTFITSPQYRGYPDYLAAMNQRQLDGVATADNAAIPLWSTLGFERCSKEYVNGVYSMWNVPQPTAKPVFLPYEDWARSHGYGGPPDGHGMVQFDGVEIDLGSLGITETCYTAEVHAVLKGPWSYKAHPMLAAWVTAILIGVLVLVIYHYSRKCRIVLVGVGVLQFAAIAVFIHLGLLDAISRALAF